MYQRFIIRKYLNKNFKHDKILYGDLKMVKLSIIVPVFNVEKYISECIDSILNQRFKDFELILVNDGSTDFSGSICDKYADLDVRIKVFHKENAGQSSARNFGLDEATGDYIGFVDSDDWIHENMFYKLIEHATKSENDIVACNFWIMDKNGMFKPYNGKSFDYEYNKDSAMKEIYTNKTLTFSLCNKIYSKRLFRKLRFREGIILEDMDIAYKLIYDSNRITYFRECLYFYRYNPNSTLRSEFTIKRLDEYDVRYDLYKFYKEKYPTLSELVYFDFCKVRSSLFACILRNKVINSENFNYLINYDIEVLRKAMKNKNIKLKNRLEICLLINFPSKEVHIRSTWSKFNQYLSNIKVCLKFTGHSEVSR